MDELQLGVVLCQVVDVCAVTWRLVSEADYRTVSFQRTRLGWRGLRDSIMRLLTIVVGVALPLVVEVVLWMGHVGVGRPRAQHSTEPAGIAGGRFNIRRVVIQNSIA